MAKFTITIGNPERPAACLHADTREQASKDFAEVLPAFPFHQVRLSDGDHVLIWVAPARHVDVREE